MSAGGGPLDGSSETPRTDEADAGSDAEPSGRAVVVATSGPDVPAGCTEAQQTVSAERAPTDLKVTQDLVDEHRTVASGLEDAAAKATDTRVKSALQSRAEQRNTLAKSTASEGDGLGGDVHPDVRTASWRTRHSESRSGTPVCSPLSAPTSWTDQAVSE